MWIPCSVLFALYSGCTIPLGKSGPDRPTRGTSAPGDDWAPGDDSASADDSAAVDDPSLVDGDGDGWFSDEDCDDDNAMIHPGAEEVCNGVDDNCVDGVDEGVLEEWFRDGDGDGYGHEPLGSACEAPEEGAVTSDGDCADDDATIHPLSTIQVDGQDSDCDGNTDWLVTILSAVDDAGELCVNDIPQGSTGGWVDGAAHEMWLTSGPNSIGIYGWDTGRVITAAIAHIQISDGSVWVTDSTWRYDPDPDQHGVGRLEWCAVGFDDSEWDLALDVGPIGDPSNPWGSAPSLFPEGSPAHWIWDHFPVDLNSQYLRKEFVLP
jgi:hypothetical protein